MYPRKQPILVDLITYPVKYEIALKIKLLKGNVSETVYVLYLTNPFLGG